MVISAGPTPRAPWQEGHFIGGHPVLDLTNTVFNRSDPAADNELLKSPADVLSWCESVGLFDSAPQLTGAAARKLVTDVHDVREHAWAAFEAVSRGDAIPTEDFGCLLELAGAGARAGHFARVDTSALDANWQAPGAIPTVLSLLAVHALFTLPPDRIRACNRCGWLFLDSSRGGRRRWCSMSTCGNREKASRHRQVVS
jgi:predicted RNA-binding Zn ribbon-like protein